MTESEAAVLNDRIRRAREREMASPDFGWTSYGKEETNRE